MLSISSKTYSKNELSRQAAQRHAVATALLAQGAYVHETEKQIDLALSDGALIGEEFRQAFPTIKALSAYQLKLLNRNIKNKYEYDLVAYNPTQVFVGQVRLELTRDEVQYFANKALPYFAEGFPKYSAGRTIYGMLGALQITTGAAREARRRDLILLRVTSDEVIAENLPTGAGVAGG